MFGLNSFGRVGAAIRSAFGFDPESLFRNNEVGVFFDPSDLPTMFQDSAGTTPVTVDGQPVGLILDKSKGLVLGSELVTNGTFNTDTTGWTPGTATLSVVSNTLQVEWLSGVSFARQIVPTVVGKTYKFVVDCIKGTSPLFLVYAGPVAGASNYANINGSVSKTYTYYFVATSTTCYVQCYCGTNSAGNNSRYDNISVKELPGNHALQATAASRPLLSARVNLLTKTEDFDNAAWVKQEILPFGSGSVSNAITAPDGTMTADLIVPTTVISFNHRVYSTTLGVFNSAHTWHIKAGGYSKIGIREAGGTANAYISIDLNTATVISIGAAASNANVVSLPNGWVRVQVVFAVASSQRASIYALNDSYVSGDFVSLSYAGDGTSGVYVWGAALVTAAQASLPYQRVNTSTDYDTVGFPKIIDYDAVDDVLNTTFPSSLGSDCTVARANVGAAPTILTGQTIGTTWAESTDNAGLIIVNRALTTQETNDVTAWLLAKGAAT